MDYLEYARNTFSADKFATEATGIEIIDAGPDYAKCSMKILPKHKNALGAVMGGAIFTIADFAFAIASNIDRAPTVSLTSQITYLGACKGDTVFAETRCIKSGRSTCTFEIIITDNTGSLMATVITTGFRKAK